MPFYAEIHEGQVVGVAIAASLEAAKKRLSCRSAKVLVELPENLDGWSIASANAHLFPLPLTPERSQP